jgi:hypothetical protein
VYTNNNLNIKTEVCPLKYLQGKKKGGREGEGEGKGEEERE